jgi:hypothetical protein
MPEVRARVRPAETVLTGELDQAGLQTLLGTLQDLGLMVRSLRQTLVADEQRSGDQQAEVRVRGRLDAQACHLLDPVEVRAEGDQLVLVCSAADATQVHRLIDLVRTFRLDLVEIRLRTAH